MDGLIVPSNSEDGEGERKCCKTWSEHFLKFLPLGNVRAESCKLIWIIKLFIALISIKQHYYAIIRKKAVVYLYRLSDGINHNGLFSENKFKNLCSQSTNPENPGFNSHYAALLPLINGGVESFETVFTNE